MIGQARSSQGAVAQEVVADRIRFHGKPSFDPRPYLDPGGRDLYERPLLLAMPKEEFLGSFPRAGPRLF